jgi:Mrp family chromosome partitioning ATPase
MASVVAQRHTCEGNVTGIFDLINRRVASDAPADLPPTADAHLPEGGPSTVQRPRPPLQTPPPLQDLPNKWVLEIQKVVFHLTAVGESDGPPQAIVFSSMQRGVGNTTASYLVAHHIAAESSDRRVLFVDFSTEKSDAKPPAHTLLQMGREIQSAQLAPGQQTLTRVSVRQEDEQSLASVSGWCRDFLTLARAYYDVIVVDAPPFFGAPETYSMAKASDGVVLILRAGESRYPAVNALAADLGQLGIGILGAVINHRQYPIPQWLLRYI